MKLDEAVENVRSLIGFGASPVLEVSVATVLAALEERVWRPVSEGPPETAVWALQTFTYLGFHRDHMSDADVTAVQLFVDMVNGNQEQG